MKSFRYYLSYKKIFILIFCYYKYITKLIYLSFDIIFKRDKWTWNIYWYIPEHLLVHSGTLIGTVRVPVMHH